MKIPRLLLFVIIVVISYGIFKAPGILLNQPIPSSLIVMYMFFAVVTTLLWITSTEKDMQGLVGPIKTMIQDPTKKTLRNIVFVIVPLVAGGITYTQLKPSYEAPVELRSIHPAPPSTVKAFGKTFNLATLVNPYRKLEKEDPAKFTQLVKEGGEVYFKNCFYCHGDKLDGKGHYAHGFNPLPLAFTDIGTIAQLQESFVFWRISTGGPGLPKEAAPWVSAMPVWENFITEDEVWKVILFLYNYTGYAPRSWEK
ncbi:MAG: cytochrome c [Deltaproteobacteria bacterium]|nr:cytochrome c [Deltaproteobacteria bacterium]